VGEHRSRLIEQLSGVRALLFDMDGTLVDSDAAVERAWAAWCEEYGIDLASVLPAAHGVPADRTVRRVRPDASDEDVLAFAARQLELQYGDLRDVVPTTGAHELLTVLAESGVPWAVVTSADRRLAAARLQAADIAAPVLVTVEDVAAGKPDPAGYQLAAERLVVPIDRCLVVEDAAPGLEAGRRAGALTAGLRGLPGDVTISDLTELAALLDVAWRAGATPVPNQRLAT
jgi:sugar-phosphatase